MKPWSRSTVSSQIAAYLRSELADGRWQGTMPGQFRLAAEIGAPRNATEAALRQLELEGLIQSQGPGRERIIINAPLKQARSMRIGIIDYEPVPILEEYMVDLIHQLMEAGHSVFVTPKTLMEMHMNLSEIRKMVKANKVDAWVVCSAPRNILEWFATQPVPTFAFFGQRQDLPIAAVGPDKAKATIDATRALLMHGHRRIVMLSRKATRIPELSVVVRAFLNELRSHGITPSAYHLPDWDENPNGLQNCFESLFRVTPPTAIILDEVPFFVAALLYSSTHRIRIPEDLSLVCADPSAAFEWAQPTVAHIQWDTKPVVRRIVRWAANISKGKKDLRQTLTPAKFVSAGTIGHVKKSS